MKRPVMAAGEVTRICEMLTHRRPAGSWTEAQFIARYLDTIPGLYADQYGNRMLLCPESRVMISCHTDSVHRMDGKQRVAVSPDGVVSLAKREKLSNCLGADDAAGIYAALRMIEAGVKVNYIFHRAEECGGKGSSWLAANYGDWLQDRFDICLALDRRGTDDVIVNQRWEMCASEEFACGLADQLDMFHAPADGIFMDSANYTDLIAECSNLSIGYDHEHTTAEVLDLNYLEEVIHRLIAVDWAGLPVVRQPGDTWPGIVEPDDTWPELDEYDLELAAWERLRARLQ